MPFAEGDSNGLRRYGPWPMPDDTTLKSMSARAPASAAMICTPSLAGRAICPALPRDALPRLTPASYTGLACSLRPSSTRFSTKGD